MGVVFLGVILIILVVMLIVIVVSLIEYILYSISLYGITKKKMSFMPFYNMYLFGTAGSSNIYGIIFLVLGGIKIFSCIWLYTDIFKEIEILNQYAFNFFIGVILLEIILKIINANGIFKKFVSKEKVIIFTVLSSVSLGFFIPIFLLTMKNGIQEN